MVMPRSSMSLRPALLIVSAAMLLVPASPALAFFDQFRIEPTVPAEGESFTYRFRAGLCHAVGRQPLSLMRSDELIELVVPILDNSFSPGFCNIPIHYPFYDLDGLPAGNYRIDLYTVDVQNNPNVRVLRSQLPFQVVAGAPAPQAVPANAGWAVLVLCLLVGSLALRRLAQ
jgi:hypothetical protein